MKYLTLAILVLSFTSVQVVAAGLSNKARFIPLLQSKLGAYEVVASNSSLCVNANLTFINPNNADNGFMLGEQIVFNSLHNGTRTIKKPNFCFITSSLKYKKNGIENSLRMSRCDNPINEKSLSQTLVFLDNNTLKYTLTDPEVECEYKKLSD